MTQKLQDTLFRLEQVLLQPEVRADRERLKLLLAEDFQEIGRSGPV